MILTQPNSAMVLNSVFVALLTPVIAYAVMRCLPWLFNLHSLVKHNPIRSGLKVCCILLATVNIPTVKIALSFSSIFITKYFIKWYVFASFFGRRNTLYGFNSILHNNHEVIFLTVQFRVAKINPPIDDLDTALLSLLNLFGFYLVSSIFFSSAWKGS